MAPLPALFAAACATADPDPEWIARDAAMRAPLAAVAAPETFAAGFDAPLAGHGLQRGDHVLFGLELDEHGARREWLVRVEVIDPQHQRHELRDGTVACLVRVGAEVYDRAGAQLGRDELVLSARQLERGLARACRGEQAQPATPASNAPGELFAPMPERIEATLALHTLLAVVRKSKLLYGVLYEVIDKPSLWSVITHFGVRVSTLDHFDQARPAAPFTLGSGAGAVEVPAWEAPLELRLNGAPALRSIVTVVDPVSPLILCTGVVALRAFRPSDPKVTFTLRLLAARRGSVP